MCRHFDLNFSRGLQKQKIFLIGVDVTQKPSMGGRGVQIINEMAQYKQ